MPYEGFVSELVASKHEAVGTVPVNGGCKSEASMVGDKCGGGGQVRLPRRPALHGTRYIGKERLNHAWLITLRANSRSDA